MRSTAAPPPILAKLHRFNAGTTKDSKFDDTNNFCLLQVFAIAQSITIMVSSGFGLGKHFDGLSDSKKDNFFKVSLSSRHNGVLCDRINAIQTRN